MNYIYTRSYPPCSYCTRVKALLDAYGIPYVEKDIAYTENMLGFLSINHPTVPAVFLNNELIGGFDATAAFLRKPSETNITHEVNK